MIGAEPASTVHAEHRRLGRIAPQLPWSSASQRLHGRPRTVRGAAEIQHPFRIGEGTSLWLDYSLRSNSFDVFCIRKLRQIDVSNFAPTFSTGHAYEEFFRPLEEYNCSYFGALYSLTRSPIEPTTRNSKIENLTVARRALNHKLQDRLIHNGAARRNRGTTSRVEHQYRSRPIAAGLANVMTSVFRHNDAYTLRIDGRESRAVALMLSARTALNCHSIRLGTASQLRPCQPLAVDPSQT
jgi:hypothetical protein